MMNRNKTLWARRGLAVAIGLAAGCALLGNEAPFPATINTSGMGPFRPLTDGETGLGAAAPIDPTAARVSVDRAQVTGDAIFFGGAAVLAAPAERAADLRPLDIDWAQYEARSIWRATGESELAFDFAAATEILVASEAWEGAWVGEPWVHVSEDGAARLYYAAEGGIGVAESDSATGTFGRVGTEPVLAGAFHNPSVIETPDGEIFMYFDDGVDVWLARSDDGLSFTIDTDASPIDLSIEEGNETENDLTEVAHFAPGAIVATTPVGRQLVRLYANVHGELPVAGEGDDRLVIALASVDGVTFSRAQLPALNPEGLVEAGQDPFALSHPTPRILESGDTLLYTTRTAAYTADNAADVIGQRVIVSVAPAFTELPGFVAPVEEVEAAESMP